MYDYVCYYVKSYNKFENTKQPLPETFHFSDLESEPAPDGFKEKSPSKHVFISDCGIEP